MALTAFTSSGLGIIPLKVASRDVSAEGLTLLLLLSAAIFNSLFELPARRRQHVTKRKQSNLPGLWAAILLALASIGGNYCAAQSVLLLNAGMTSVFIRMQVLFTVMLAWLWIGERVTLRFVFGTLVAIAGIVAMKIEENPASASFIGMAWGVLSGACFGSMQVITRRYIKDIDPLRTNTQRLWLSVFIVAFFPNVWQSVSQIDLSNGALIALSAFLGPFIGRVLLIQSAKYISAALAILIGFIGPIVTLMADWLVLSAVPLPAELLGCMVILVGMLYAISGGSRIRDSS